MISNNNISNIHNLDIESVEKAMLDSHIILTKRGEYRDSISYLGQSKFDKSHILNASDTIDTIEKEIKNKALIQKLNELNISIDISLIDRKTLANIFTIIIKLGSEIQFSINIIYTLANYSPPSGALESNNLVKPVSPFFSGWTNRPGLPIMTIVGLGYERDKAMGAIELLISWLSTRNNFCQACRSSSLKRF